MSEFKSFDTANGWNVDLQGDTLYIACKEFKAKAFLAMLVHLVDCQGNRHRSFNSPEFVFYACRSGIHYECADYNDYTLSWDDAARILNQLKTAGVV